MRIIHYINNATRRGSNEKRTEAIDKVFGDGAYMQIAGDIYDELRAKA